MGGQMVVQVPRKKKQPAREATLELRWQEVEVKPPQVGFKKTWPPVKMYAVLAREVWAGPGIEPIEWLLLTTWPVTSLKMARRIVRWYALRWGIECWHKALKSVCRVEDRQMKSATTLERALAFDMVVSWRVLLLTRMGKEHPNLPASLFYDEAELRVLKAVVVKKNFKRENPRAELTAWEANILVAMLAGFWARKSDGHPGTKIFSEGLIILMLLVWWESLPSPEPDG